MKKLVLTKILCIGVILSDTAFASIGQFYLRGEIGANKIQDIKVNGKKFSQSNAALYGAGVGYYFLENLRADLVVNSSKLINVFKLVYVFSKFAFSIINAIVSQVFY